jgi:hypothetical protein
MKLSHEKLIQLSHRVLTAIEQVDEIEVFDEPNAIRQEILKVLTALLQEEEKIEETVRQRILSQRRAIPEGGAEWDILYRKYYSDELRKLGITFNLPWQHTSARF